MNPLDDKPDPIFAIDCSIASAAFEGYKAGQELRPWFFDAWSRVESESMNPVRSGLAWLDHLFRAGVGGALLHFKDDPVMSRRIRQEVHLLRQFSVMLDASRAGISTGLEGFGSVFDGGEKPEPLDLTPMFRDWRSAMEKESDPCWRRARSMAGELERYCKEHGIHGTFGSVEVRRG